jgi:SAM-dependent methyltransferase
VVGVDCAADAVDFARENYRLPNLWFEQGSCVALPHPDSVFDLVVAFEVIEHLENWRDFLREARRVLSQRAVHRLDANKLYYTNRAARRGQSLPRARIRVRRVPPSCAVFPHISMFLENHVEGVTFQPHEPSHTAEVGWTRQRPDESHFFVACARTARSGNPTFVTCRAPPTCCASARHIAKLERAAQKDEWLAKAQRPSSTASIRNARHVPRPDRRAGKSNAWAED